MLKYFIVALAGLFFVSAAVARFHWCLLVRDELRHVELDSPRPRSGFLLVVVRVDEEVVIGAIDMPDRVLGVVRKPRKVETRPIRTGPLPRPIDGFTLNETTRERPCNDLTQNRGQDDVPFAVAQRRELFRRILEIASEPLGGLEIRLVEYSICFDLHKVLIYRDLWFSAQTCAVRVHRVKYVGGNCKNYFCGGRGPDGTRSKKSPPVALSGDPFNRVLGI